MAKERKHKTPQELLESGDFIGAVNLLKTLNSQDSNKDENLRLLARCYSELEKYQEALNAVLDVKVKDFKGFCRKKCF